MGLIFFRGKIYNSKSVPANGIAYGNSSNDWFEALFGNNTIYANDGDNVILAGVKLKQINGWPQQTLIVTPIANAGNNTIYAGNGNDTVVTGAGNDTVYLNGGNNSYDGLTGGNDTIYAGNGNDRFSVKVTGITKIYADEGQNIIDGICNGLLKAYAGSGDDRVNLQIGAGGYCDLNLGEGHNRITLVGSRIASSKQSTITTGSGKDFISVIQVHQPFNINSGEGDDFIKFENGPNNGSIPPTSFSQIDAGNGNNLINSSSTDGYSIGSGWGNDVIAATLSTNYGELNINAEEGNNQIAFSAVGYPNGKAQVKTGSGHDVIFALDSVYAFIDAGEGNNYIQSSSPLLQYRLPSGGLMQGSRSVTITAGSGKDTFNLGKNGGAIITRFDAQDKIILNDVNNLSVTTGFKPNSVEVYQGGTLRAIVENSNVGLVQQSISAGSTRRYSSELEALMRDNRYIPASAFDM